MNATTVLHGLAISEIVINIVTLINAFIMIRIFIKIKTLHIYFRTVSFCLFGFATLRSLTRLTLIVFYLAKLLLEYPMINLYLLLFYMYCSYVINFAQISFIVERAISSLHDSKYEKMNSMAVMASYVLVPVIAATMPILATYVFKVIEFNTFLWFSTTYNFLISVAFFLFVKFYHPWRCRKQRRTWALSARYQQQQNLRISVTMKWFGVFCVLQNVCITVFCLWSLLKNGKDYKNSDEVWLLYAATDFLLSLSTALYPISFIATIEHVRRLYLQTILCKEIKSNRTSVIEANTTENHELYFIQLQKQWN